MNTAKKTGRPPILTARIVAEVEKAGSQGIESTEIFRACNGQIKAETVRSTLCRVVKAGLVFMAEGRTSRYFALKDWADAAPKSKPVRERTWFYKFSLDFVETVKSMIQKSCEAGVDIAELMAATGRHVHNVQAVLSGLHRDGFSFTGRSLNKWRYFSNQEWARAYADSRKPMKRVRVTVETKQKEPRPKKLQKAPRVQKAYRPNEIVLMGEYNKNVMSPLARWENQEAIIPEGVKRIVMDAPRGRFEPTGEESYFASLQIGNYKPSESVIARAYGA